MASVVVFSRSRHGDSWSVEDPPPELHAVRRRWTRFHLFRGVAAFGGFGCAVAAAMAVLVS